MRNESALRWSWFETFCWIPGSFVECEDSSCSTLPSCVIFEWTAFKTAFMDMIFSSVYCVQWWKLFLKLSWFSDKNLWNNISAETGRVWWKWTILLYLRGLWNWNKFLHYPSWTMINTSVTFLVERDENWTLKLL